MTPRCRNAGCRAPLPPAARTGRPRRYCGDRCRKAGERERGVTKPVTKPRAERVPLDAYYTDEQDARICLRAWLEDLDGYGCHRPRRLLEPSVGGGAWIEAWEYLVDGPAEWWALDVDGHASGLGRVTDRNASVGDFTTATPLAWMSVPRFDAVVGNPPYVRAEAFVRRALELGDHVVFLLRAGFEQAACRVPLLTEHPPTRVYRLTWRPKFRDPEGRPCGKTGNPHDYALFWWGPGSLGVLPPAYLTRPAKGGPS